MKFVDLLSTTVLGAISNLDRKSILQGQSMHGRMSGRRRFPQVDFYGDQPMSCGLLGHRHERVEIAVVTRGGLNVGIGEALYEARQGDWLVFHSNVIHGECALPSRRAYQLLWLISGRRGLRQIHLTGYDRQGGYQIEAHHHFDAWPADLRHDWVLLTGKTWTEPAKLRLILARQVCEMMTQIAEQSPQRRAKVHPMVQEVRELLDAHEGKRPTVVDLANAVGLSPNYLSNLFRRETGIHLHTYIDKLRIERAKALFSETDMSVKQVAFSLAFADPHHFSRVFRRVTGMSPSAFRDRSKKQTRGR